MPLPRFDKLDPPRRRTILQAAAEEFGDRGFEQASYNRIIERAGISKGAMYYYFADKDDLFRTVLTAALEGWFEEVGYPFEADDAQSFWAACRQMYARSLRFMLRDPRNATLCLTITRAQARMESHPLLVEVREQFAAWARALIEQGQRLGAVRSDVPVDLLSMAAVSLMEAGDRWLDQEWERVGEERVEDLATMMVGMFRRLGAPDQEVGATRQETTP